MSAEVVPHSNLQKPEARPGDLIKLESRCASFDRFSKYGNIPSLFSAVCNDPQWQQALVTAESSLLKIADRTDRAKVASISLFTFVDFERAIKSGRLALTGEDRSKLISELLLQFNWDADLYFNLAPIGFPNFLSSSKDKLPNVAEIIRSITTAAIAIQDLSSHCKAARCTTSTSKEAASKEQEFARTFTLTLIAEIFSRATASDADSVTVYCNFAKKFVSQWPDRAPYALMATADLLSHYRDRPTVQQIETIAEKITEVFSRTIEKFPDYTESKSLLDWTRTRVTDFMRVLSGGQSRNFSYPKWDSAALEVLLCSGIISLDYRQAEKVSLLLGKIVRKPGFYAENNGDLELLAGVLRNAKDMPALQVLQLIDEKLEDSNSLDHAETLRRLGKMAADFKGSAGA